MTTSSTSLNQPPNREAVVWPKAPLGVQPGRAAERLDTLEGARIGFLWDDLFRGDELFPVLERELTARFTGLEVIGYESFGSTHGADEAGFISALPSLLHELKVDAVVSGMGC